MRHRVALVNQPCISPKHLVPLSVIVRAGGAIAEGRFAPGTSRPFA
ncbi:hypothetical protein L541_1246 [Bordetella hinzii CA90 BAL1384]|uniref:Uncharacterized protein n=1 Tax=Bordetella hinzii OH87 BAL007II TaxID=1331262 RepID=A0ABR4R6P7_9BORD|nr:hypothetical protein ACR55_01118 [Bordetella hinzii]KCB26385.1 hypothetical protein L544_2981 [Bordetella hinzii OH87 BAL007II]KCB33457.1 hypothetical protein L541_1246 [Bordetella hinzii CA90 BAL1384]KCB41084.1 hypothetical protein L539_3273 [Bordetella hinzii 5132]KCB47950.1 hypothetical protein L538_3099 [Bordetella hinzii 4161]KCB52802.1 hypothetical protein L537_3305 [Bordetella hinzii 1277]